MEGGLHCPGLKVSKNGKSGRKLEVNRYRAKTFIRDRDTTHRAGRHRDTHSHTDRHPLGHTVGGTYIFIIQLSGGHRFRLMQRTDRRGPKAQRA